MDANSNAIRNYFQLTKPTIIVLVAITGFCTMAAEGSFAAHPIRMLLVLAAIILSAGSANAFNQFIDRDIDAVMHRTRARRPLPLQQIHPLHAFMFALALGILSNAFLWIYFNALSALISIATILFYVFVYTLWLKRRHYYNIVIGGAAGATAPLIASAAAYGHPSWLSWILFLVIFMWTPPHFWALALAVKEDYASVRVPMLPNVLGDRRTRIEIWIYTLLLLPISLLPLYLDMSYWIYGIGAIALWIWYLRETWLDFQIQTVAAYKKLFFVSIGYLFFLFIVIGVNGVVKTFLYGKFR